MKYLAFLSLFIFSFFLAKAQFPVSPNALTENGMRTGQWTILYDSVFKRIDNPDSAVYYRLARFENGKPVGKIRDFYRSGIKQWDGYLTSIDPDVFDGEYRQYHENGKLYIVTNYKDGMSTGPYKEYSFRGTLAAEGQRENNKAQGRWLVYYENGKIAIDMMRKDDLEEGMKINFYESGQISAKGMMKEGKREGTWEFFHENGNLKSRSAYAGGEFNGFSEDYYEDGTLKEKGQCKDGYYTGYWTFYSPTGKKEQEGNYDAPKGKMGLWKKYNEEGNPDSEYEMVESKKHGTFTSYHPNGKIAAQGFYQDDHYAGAWTYFNDQGITLTQGFYYDTDSMTGKWTYYHLNGTINVEGTYEKNQRDGQWVYHFDHGGIQLIENNVNRVLQGEWIQYHPNGKIFIARNYDLGKQHGLAETYFDNGQLNERGQYDRGLKTGVWMKYYADGKTDVKSAYIADTLDGEFISYFDDGTLFEQGIYDHGRKTGVWKKYYRNGQVSTRQEYVNGKYTWVSYYETGLKKSVSQGTGTGTDDKDEGYRRHYFANGKLESEGIVVNGLPEGKFIYYDSLSGKKNTIGNFVHGKYDKTWRFYDAKGKLSSTQVYINGFYESVQNVADSILALVRLGDYDAATAQLAWLNRVLKRDVPKPDVRWLRPLDLQGDIYFGRKQHDKALAMYQQYAIEVKRFEGDTTNRYLTALNGIAVCYSGLERYEEALQINQFLLEKWKEKKDDYSTFVYNKAVNLSSLKRGEEGENILKEEWQRRIKVYGDSSVEALKALDYLVRFQSNFESKYAEALEGYKELSKHSKDGDPYYLSLMRDASRVLRNLKRDQDAAGLLQLAMEYQVTHKLDGYMNYVDDAIFLSETYYAMNEYENSLKAVTDVLAAFQKNNKNETYQAARLLHRASVVTRNGLSDPKRAIQFGGTAKEILEKRGEQESGLYADVIDQMASSHYNDPATFDQAEKYYLQALAISDNRYGDHSASHYSDMLTLGNYYTNGFKLTQADSVFKVVGKDIYERLDSTSSILARYENHLGNLSLFNYKYSDAIRHYQNVVDFYRKKQATEPIWFGRSLKDLARAYSTSGDKVSAERLIREALTVYENNHEIHSPVYFDTRKELGRVLSDQFLYKESEAVYISLIKSHGEAFGENNSDYRNFVFELGQLQVTMNEYKKAGENLGRAIALSLKNSGAVPEENYYIVLQSLAGLKNTQREFGAAENYFSQAKRAAQPYRSSVTYALFLQRYGSFAAEQGRYAQAEQLLTEALNAVTARVGERHWFYASIANDLVKTYQQLGKNAEAEQLITKALAAAEGNKTESESSYITIMSSLVQNLRSMGRYEDAVKLQNTVIVFVEKQHGRNVHYAVALLDQASVYIDMKQHAKAKTLLKTALLIFEETLAADHENVLIAMNQLGLVHLALGEIDEAQTCFQYDIDKRIANGKTNSPSHTVALHNMGNTLMREGKFAEAEKSYNASIALRKMLNMEYNLESQVAVLDDIAILYQGWGKDELAEKYWKETLQKMLTYIHTNFSFLSDYEKAKFWERTKFDFENFNTFAVHRAEKNPLILGDMYNYRLATKGILLSASNKLRKRIYASHDSTLIRQYHEWTEFREQLAKEYTSVASDQKTPRIDSLDRSINGLEKELSISTEDSKADRDQLITWKEVQRTLASDEAAVELIRFHYFNRTLTDSVVYAALVITAETKTNPKLVVMGNGDFLDTKAYRYYRNSITSQMEDVQSYRNFWGRIEPLVTAKKRIYLSLDGVFNQVNLKTLLTPGGTYLMDTKDFVIVSNTRDLIAMKSRKKLRLMETASLIGNPAFFTGSKLKTTGETRGVDEDRSGIAELPGTKVEIETVENLLDANGWKVNSLVQHEATEEHMKQLPSSRVVHLATHGFFQDDQSGTAQDPMLRSGILLTGAADFIQNRQETGGENGILTAYEAANLSLEGTEMVVLSACETARGEIQQGEGVYGLQRAFITAGAESLVMSLWKVDDEATQKLMSLFYENWMKGMEKSEALNQAQRTLKKLYPHPYYWGAFVMMRG